LHITIGGSYTNVGIIQTLIDLEADISARNTDVETPLHIAAKNDGSHVITCFIENEANVDEKIIRNMHCCV